MGSRPWFCRHCKKFLTSAIIKWWFSTSKVPIWRENSTTLQKEDLFLSSSYSKGILHHYKMKIGFYMFFIIRLLEGNTSALQNDDWKGYAFHCWLRLGFHMLTSEGQLPLLQNEIGFSHVAFRRATSLATKWDWIFVCCLPMGKFPCYKMTFDF